MLARLWRTASVRMNKADNRNEYIHMGTDFRKEIGATIDQRSSEYTKISDAIWGFAEPRFQEYESSKLQQEFLKSRGFSIKSDLAGEETAFIAEWGSGKLPDPGKDELTWLRSSSARNSFRGCGGFLKNVYGREPYERNDPLLWLPGRRECRRKSISGPRRLL